MFHKFVKLDKRSFIHEEIDSLTSRETALGLVLGNGLLAAAGRRLGALVEKYIAKLIDGFYRHTGTSLKNMNCR